jgi:hypothetical protein
MKRTATGDAAGEPETPESSSDSPTTVEVLDSSAKGAGPGPSDPPQEGNDEAISDQISSLVSLIGPYVNRYLEVEKLRIEASGKSIESDSKVDQAEIAADVKKVELRHNTATRALSVGGVVLVLMTGIFAYSGQLELLASNLKEVAAMLLAVAGAYAVGTKQTGKSSDD